MYKLILIVHVFLSCMLIGLVLIQRGKGAEAGASFGGGASQTIFGSQGSVSFLVKITALVALLFAGTSITLTKMVTSDSKSGIIDLGAVQAAQGITSDQDNSGPEAGNQVDLPE